MGGSPGGARGDRRRPKAKCRSSGLAPTAIARSRSEPIPRCPALPPVPQQPRPVALPVALLGGLALVVGLLALAQPQLDLRPALVVEVDLQRHHRVALALGSADQLVDLAAVQQQPARALG